MNNKIKTPRGLFLITVFTEEELRRLGYGLWFQYHDPETGKDYDIMHRWSTQTAVAVMVKEV